MGDVIVDDAATWLIKRMDAPFPSRLLKNVLSESVTDPTLPRNRTLLVNMVFQLVAKQY